MIRCDPCECGVSGCKAVTFASAVFKILKTFLTARVDMQQGRNCALQQRVKLIWAGHDMAMGVGKDCTVQSYGSPIQLPTTDWR